LADPYRRVRDHRTTGEVEEARIARCFKGLESVEIREHRIATSRTPSHRRW
jgi:hypothetical protein